MNYRHLAYIFNFEKKKTRRNFFIDSLFFSFHYIFFFTIRRHLFSAPPAHFGDSPFCLLFLFYFLFNKSLQGGLARGGGFDVHEKRGGHCYM